MPDIALLYRKKGIVRYSIEGVFRPLDTLPDINRIELPCDLNSLYNVFKLIGFAFKIRERNIHITGDIHYMAIFLFWKRIVLTVHDCNHYEKLTGLRKKLMGFIWYTLPLRIANRITVISPYVKEQLIEHFNFNYNKIEIIPNSFYPIKINKSDFKNNEFTVLAIGSNTNKNRRRLIEAVKDLEHIEINFIGKLSVELVNLLNTYKVKYKNSYQISKSELESSYNSADVLFFASTKEGFGLPILEAQSCGLPVITSITTSMPFVAGNGACIIDPYDIEAIKKAILKVKNETMYRQTIVETGFLNMNRFVEDNFISSFKNLYETVFKLQLK